MNKQKLKEFFSWGPVWVLIGMGIFTITIGSCVNYFLCLNPWWEVRKSVSWHPVKAVVLSSKVNTRSHHKGGLTYSIDLRYEYRWKETQYIGNRYWFWPDTSDGAKLHSMIRRMPKGRVITCYIDPANPSESVISRESNFSITAFVLCTIFIIIGISILIFTIKSYCKGTLKNEWEPVEKK
jgi:hypothetical protein